MKFKHKKHGIAGCDTRVVTKSYLYTPGLRDYYGEKDLPKVLGEMIQDPPIVIDNPGHFGLSAQGVSIMPDATTGVYHVWDWIGKDNYPRPSDIWMQIIEKDDSTLIDIKHTPLLNKLTEFESMRVLIHPNGSIKNPSPLKKDRLPVSYMDDCFLPDGEYREMHLADNEEMCSALWWQDGPGKPISDDDRYVDVEVGDLTYNMVRPLAGYVPEYELAMIGKIFVAELHLVVGDMKENDPDVNAVIEEAMAFLDKTVYGLPVYATDN